MEQVNESRPYGAYEGGAKVLLAVLEVLEHGGSKDRAIEAGNAALSDLRPLRPGIPIYATSPGGNLQAPE